MSNVVSILNKSNSDALIEYVKMLRFGDQLPTLINACRSTLGKPNLPITISKGQAYRHLNGFEQFVADVLTYIADQRVQSQRQFHFMEPYAVFHEKASDRIPFGYKNNQDAKAADGVAFQQTCLIYKSIRRHIFRRLIKSHKSCFRLAQRALWWDIDGERIKSFCPSATAFIRWRMHWEGCRIPSNLDSSGRPQTHYGIVGWLAGDAPIGSSQWTENFEHWVHTTLFGCHCMGDFNSWLKYSTIQSSKPSTVWRMLDYQQFTKRHWAVCGCGSSIEPGYLFVQDTTRQSIGIVQTELNHRQNTCKIIASIKH